MTRARVSSGETADATVDMQRPATTPCAHPDCTAHGAYRAPKSRDALTDYHWFCLEHVREYNAAWNYYAGMDDAAIERSVREDSVWRRPTWPLGLRQPADLRFEDAFNLFRRADTIDPRKAREAEAQLRNMTGDERRALTELGLAAPVTLEDVKIRYKILAKTLHPDANGGDKVAEERLKSVNHAYKTLRDSDRLA